jgi:cyclic beta-1,2-glucan synthetase
LIVLHSWGISGYLLVLLALLGLVPSFDAAVALVNQDVTRGLGATILPGLVLREGIPLHLRTMIVVPALLTTGAALEEQIDRLEIHYLASPEAELPQLPIQSARPNTSRGDFGRKTSGNYFLHAKIITWRFWC